MDEVDPLDAYMANLESELHVTVEKPKSERSSSIMPDFEDEADEELPESEPKESLETLVDPAQIIANAQRKLKKKDLLLTNHAAITYEPFRKDFFVQASEIAAMTEKEVSAFKDSLGVKSKGACPRPIKKFTQCGLSNRILSVLKYNYGFDKPTPIQSASIPAVMSGKDVISIASTGSGKTLAYLIPLFRHVLDQRPLAILEGPIALILAPTRELAVQITLEVKKFTKHLAMSNSRKNETLRVVCAFGGSDIKAQIGELKRGAEIVVATPGRLIDLLVANSGRVANLKRVTFVVLDEADRMFDMGFEPQVSKILSNARPDKQVLLYSATFPKGMEICAKRWLKNPVEITAGGRSVVNSNIEQEIHVVDDENSKFPLLLSILGKAFNEDPNTQVLIFVDRQENADALFKELLKRAYPCLTIHGGKDQSDRGSSMEDFKHGDIPILIATSVAARGLDVPSLPLVINFSVPNHLEDYVHRVGRTGRAGRQGKAITFITLAQERYAGDLVRALVSSNTAVPEPLKALASSFDEKVKAGTERAHGGGFGGKGLDRIDMERDRAISVQKQAYGEAESEDEQELVELEGELVATDTKPPTSPALKETLPEPSKATAPSPVTWGRKRKSAELDGKLAELQKRINARIEETSPIPETRDVIAEINARFGSVASVVQPGPGAIVPIIGIVGGVSQVSGYRCEIDINDFPQYARYKVMTKDLVSTVQDATHTSIVVRGSYIDPSSATKMQGEKRLHMMIEGQSDRGVQIARDELLNVLREETENAVARGSVDVSVRYSVV